MLLGVENRSRDWHENSQFIVRTPQAGGRENPEALPIASHAEDAEAGVVDAVVDNRRQKQAE